MRRKRSQLAVSTFPFLAVLLCAMGALILFLLVMDRRAKIVARNKALKAVTLAQEQEQRIEAELVSRRKQHHDQLAKEHAELLTQQKKLERDALELQAKLKAGEQTVANVSQRYTAESEAAAVAQSKLQEYGRKLTDSKTQAGRAHAKLLYLTAELEKLENTVKQFKAINERPTEVVALVPYRGVNADQRRPIYVECRADGFTLQPDRLVLAASSTTPLELRKAIETRLAQSDSAYVLFLVRPEGIPLYYHAQASLEGLKVDFGYEFVDSDWVLELSTPEQVAMQSWTTQVREPPPLIFGGRPPQSLQPSSSAAPGPRLTNISPGGAPARSPGWSAAQPWARTVHADEAPEGRRSGWTSDALPGLEASRSPQAPDSASLHPGLRADTPPGLKAPKEKALRPEGETTNGPSPRITEGKPPSEPMPAPSSALTFRPTKTPPPPVGRLLGNRDLVFILECTRDGVLFQLTDELHPLTSLKPGAGEHPLVSEIRQLIARRQAGVQPGESPYQPSIRFRIHADGLRAYYFVYPLLEPLRIPMTRENIE